MQIFYKSYMLFSENISPLREINPLNLKPYGRGMNGTRLVFTVASGR